MEKANTRVFHRVPAVVLGLALALGWGCATPVSSLPDFHYFATPEAFDPWSHKIQRWQEREHFDGGDDGQGAPAAVAESGADEGGEDPQVGSLRTKFQSFRAERKREMAKQVADWIQLQSQNHYIADGPVDRWATTAETFRTNGDDCDGLELLTYHLLRDLGFDSKEIYRAIVYRRSDGQHHMVTLWFEDRDDPWVIDPTGAMVSGMPRMSNVGGWVPIKVFSEDEEFTVRREYAKTARRTPSN
jgi:predicted transglutaminase-like cysteine proteinase